MIPPNPIRGGHLFTGHHWPSIKSEASPYKWDISNIIPVKNWKKGRVPLGRGLTKSMHVLSVRGMPSPYGCGDEDIGLKPGITDHLCLEEAFFWMHAPKISIGTTGSVVRVDVDRYIFTLSILVYQCGRNPSGIQK